MGEWCSRNLPYATKLRFDLFAAGPSAACPSGLIVLVVPSQALSTAVFVVAILMRLEPAFPVEQMERN